MQKSQSALAFAQWFEDNGIRKSWFAKRIGVDNATITRWLTGAVCPQRASRKWVEELTNGAVAADGWET